MSGALAVSGCTTNPYTGEREAGKSGIGAGIGSLVGAGIGALSVDHHRHHVAGAQIDAQPQRCVAGGGRLVTQGRRFLQSWGEP
ncbi:hypothetical protein MJN85_31885, partial [Salmonella enterica subsp. enterica serovar Anatum]|nr:hypothetical protein [Salmonella enterica subsp. enterica serovar Anatum]